MSGHRNAELARLEEEELELKLKLIQVRKARLNEEHIDTENQTITKEKVLTHTKHDCISGPNLAQVLEQSVPQDTSQGHGKPTNQPDNLCKIEVGTCTSEQVSETHKPVKPSIPTAVVLWDFLSSSANQLTLKADTTVEVIDWSALKGEPKFLYLLSSVSNN